MLISLFVGFVDFVAKKSLSRYPQALALVAAILYSLPPGLVVQVPLYGFAQAGFEGFPGFPTQFFLDFAGVYGVAAVVARAILYVGDLVPVTGFFGGHILQYVADGLYHFNISFFVVATDVVGLPRFAVLRYQDQGSCVVFHKQPIPDLAAIAVNWQRFASKGIQNNQRNQLFREVIRAIVVAAVGHYRGQAVGALPGTYQVVGAGFAGAVRAAWRVAGGFGKQLFSGVFGLVRVWEIAVHFIGTNVMKTEVGCFFRMCLLELFPVGPGGFQQGVCTNDVGFHECGRAIYGTVYVALGGQVHDDVWLVLGQSLVHGICIANIGRDKGVAGVTSYGFQGFQVSGVGELVYVYHGVVGVVQKFTDDGGANESSATGYKKGFRHGS